MTELYTTNWSTIASINLSNFSGNWTFEEQEIDDSSYFEEATRFVSISVFILFGLIGIAGFVGNGLVVVVVSANPQMRSTTNILIINLAVADLLFVIFCVPFTAADYIFDSWPFGDFWCRFVQYMIVVTCHASVYTLVLMSLDRYLAVVHPITSMNFRTEQNALLAIAITWFIITSTAIPVGFSHGELPIPEYDIVKCMFLSADYNLAAFQISFFLSSYVLPLTLITILYVCMLARLWKTHAPVGGSSGGGNGKVSESRTQRTKIRRKTTVLILSVVLAFAACWLPIQIVLVLKSLQFYDSTPLLVGIQIASHVLAYTNSCINPILYCFISENFRKAFRKVVKCGAHHRQQSFNAHTQISTKIVRSGNGQSVEIL